jgi:hypothetical protein
MELLLALLIQSAAEPARAPRQPNRLAAAGRRTGAPREASRSRIDWGALDQSLAAGSRRERGGRPAGPRETLWNGVPVRIIDGQRHGIW